LDGVVVIGGNNLENLSLLAADPERFVVITRNGTDNLARIWEAGARHVVFDNDSPTTAQLAIMAAELSAPYRAGEIEPGRTPHGLHVH
jgi:hypothetical protein